MTDLHNIDKLDRAILRRLQENGRQTYDVIGELDNRLMPPGMEWPRFEDGEKVKYGDYIMHDGKSERVQGIYFYKSTNV